MEGGHGRVCHVERRCVPKNRKSAIWQSRLCPVLAEVAKVRDVLVVFFYLFKHCVGDIFLLSCLR